jgi:hypothetical protein
VIRGVGHSHPLLENIAPTIIVVRLMMITVLIVAKTSSHLQSYPSIPVCSRHHQRRAGIVLRPREVCIMG